MTPHDEITNKSIINIDISEHDGESFSSMCSKDFRIFRVFFLALGESKQWGVVLWVCGPQLHKTPGNIITTKIQDNKHQRIKEFLSVSLGFIFF